MARRSQIFANFFVHIVAPALHDYSIKSEDMISLPCLLPEAVISDDRSPINNHFHASVDGCLCVLSCSLHSSFRDNTESIGDQSLWNVRVKPSPTIVERHHFLVNNPFEYKANSFKSQTIPAKKSPKTEHVISWSNHNQNFHDWKRQWQKV